MSAIRAGMVYEERNGLMVAESGPVAIEGVLHRVEHGFVACDRSLNGRAWNVTIVSSSCPVCYPESREYIQGELFREVR